MTDAAAQLSLLHPETARVSRPLKSQLLKWIGNKQRFAQEIVSYFPVDIGTYFEPFLGSGAVLATLEPDRAIASDTCGPLIGIFEMLRDSPDRLKQCYGERLKVFLDGDRREVYERIRASYNLKPNPEDLLFISRACYGGVVRFRKLDGCISTPLGIHNPVSINSFSRAVDEWGARVRRTRFLHLDYREAMTSASEGDLIYCDPPYSYSQSILYGSQSFRLEELFSAILTCKRRGVFVALSIDGSKRSGSFLCDLPIPDGLFKREVMMNVGRSMLKRFQMNGKTMDSELVKDRLLLTY